MSEFSAENDKKLQDIFMDAWNLYEELEQTRLPFNSPEFQDKVQSSMHQLEDATRIVSEIGMFSANELIDEVSTESLKFLLLPFLLGKLALKLASKKRSNVLEVAEVYLKDFLQRCEEYELCDAPKEKQDTNSEVRTDELAELVRAAHSRNQKIAQFRIKKELEEQIKLMRDAVRNQTIDEEAKRDFFLKYLKKSIIEAREELRSLQLEKQMQEMHTMEMRKIHTTSDTAAEASFDNHKAHNHGHHKHTHDGKEQPKPLQPFIITRNAAQKAVFGMGYPSLPVMTVDEFYTQRVQEGIFPDEEKTAQMNRAQAIAAAKDPNEKEDEEKAAIELQDEMDDPEYLARMRRLDEYKDVVRRGDGNRYNRS